MTSSPDGHEQGGAASPVELLEQALHMAHKELELLASGDTLALEDLARQRTDLVETAMAGREGADVDQLLDKLTRLKSMQGQLTAEARRVHAMLAQDLDRARQESRRLSGYGKSSRPVEPCSRFISKQG